MAVAPRHAPLSTRKAIYARTAVLDGFSGLLETEDADGRVQAAFDVRETLLTRFAVEARRPGLSGAPNDGERLDAFAQRMGAIVAQERERAGTVGDVDLASQLDAVFALLGAIDCAACAGAVTPCGRTLHHDIVTQGGRCIGEIKDVFAFASALGAALYDDAWGRPSQPPSGRVGMSLNTTSVVLDRTEAHRVHLEARTVFLPFDQRHLSAVELAFDGDWYREVERAALPYLIAHEVIAHGFYGIMEPDARHQREPNDFWAEGWMDCVALDTLIAALEGPGDSPALLVPAYLRGTPEIVDTARSCQVHRYTAAHARDTCANNTLRQARQRYQTMAARIRAQYPQPGYDAMRPVHLACAVLNATGASPEAVAALNAKAARYTYAARNAEPFTIGERDMYEALVHFVEHHDTEQLISELR
jgi:hypothetical protein